MRQKLAVIVIHGLGKQKPDYAERFVKQLKKHYAKAAGIADPDCHLAIRPVYWAKVLEDREEQLKCKMKPYRLRYGFMRSLVIHYLADAVAYQPLETNDQIYQDVHATVSRALQALSEEAGPNAPLCVISHSLGSVIASNYFYDLQNSNGWQPIIFNPESALSRGETLSLFYSCGTTLPLWSLRYREFDRPIRVPASPAYCMQTGIRGEWVNFYDKDDILGYPLQSIHAAYERAVREDVAVNAGGLLRGWNPFSHGGYFTTGSVLRRMAAGMAEAWRMANGNH